ncbi:MAG TPA: hypothetical protein VGF95_12380 [Solirubrobacteraceae bacterium]|jgi:hypothetical protein
MTEHEDHDYFGQVERELRHAIRTGERLDSGRRPRFRGVATRPFGRLGFAFAGVTAASIVAAVVLFTVGLGADTQQAFAGWKPVPTRPAKGQRSAAEQSCRSTLSSLGQLEHRGASKVAIPKTHEAEALERLERVARSKVPPARRWKTVAVDTRGPYTLSLLFDGHRQAECFTGPSRSGHRFGTAGVDSYSRAPAPAAGEIGDFVGGVTTIGGAKGSYTFAVGRIGAGVRGVTLLLADGRQIVTTTAKGWYLAWWPGRSHATGAEVRTANGTRRVHPNFP